MTNAEGALQVPFIALGMKGVTQSEARAGPKRLHFGVHPKEVVRARFSHH